MPPDWSDYEQVNAHRRKLAIGSIALQAIGYSKEANEAKPFKGPLDFMRRCFSELYFKLPVFELSGRWRRQYQAAGR